MKNPFKRKNKTEIVIIQPKKEPFVKKFKIGLKWGDVIVMPESKTWDKELMFNINDVITIFNGRPYVLNNENFTTYNTKEFTA